MENILEITRTTKTKRGFTVSITARIDTKEKTVQYSTRNISAPDRDAVDMNLTELNNLKKDAENILMNL